MTRFAPPGAHWSRGDPGCSLGTASGPPGHAPRVHRDVHVRSSRGAHESHEAGDADATVSMALQVRAPMGVPMKPHRWSNSVRVVRDGESAFEMTCTVCGCIARDFAVWTKTLRAGVMVSASMRKVAHFKKVTDPADRQWRESRPPCEPAASVSRPFAIGDRVRHAELPRAGVVIEVPATHAGQVIPGSIRVHVEGGVYSTEAVAPEERWILVPERTT